MTRLTFARRWLAGVTAGIFCLAMLLPTAAWARSGGGISARSGISRAAPSMRSAPSRSFSSRSFSSRPSGGSAFSRAPHISSRGSSPRLFSTGSARSAPRISVPSRPSSPSRGSIVRSSPSLRSAPSIDRGSIMRARPDASPPRLSSPQTVYPSRESIRREPVGTVDRGRGFDRLSRPAESPQRDLSIRRPSPDVPRMQPDTSRGIETLRRSDSVPTRTERLPQTDSVQRARPSLREDVAQRIARPDDVTNGLRRDGDGTEIVRRGPSRDDLSRIRTDTLRRDDVIRDRIAGRPDMSRDGERVRTIEPRDGLTGRSDTLRRDVADQIARPITRTPRSRDPRDLPSTLERLRPGDRGDTIARATPTDRLHRDVEGGTGIVSRQRPRDIANPLDRIEPRSRDTLDAARLTRARPDLRVPDLSERRRGQDRLAEPRRTDVTRTTADRLRVRTTDDGSRLRVLDARRVRTRSDDVTLAHVRGYNRRSHSLVSDFFPLDRRWHRGHDFHHHLGLSLSFRHHAHLRHVGICGVRFIYPLRFVYFPSAVFYSAFYYPPVYTPLFYTPVYYYPVHYSPVVVPFGYSRFYSYAYYPYAYSAATYPSYYVAGTYDYPYTAYSSSLYDRAYAAGYAAGQDVGQPAIASEMPAWPAPDAQAGSLEGGLEALRSNDINQARRLLARAVIEQPDSGTARMLYSAALVADGHYTEAAVSLRRAMQVWPDLTTEDFYLPSVWGDEKFYRQYSQDLRAWLSDNPTRLDAWLLATWAYAFGGQPGEAMVLLAEALRAWPDDPALQKLSQLVRKDIETTQPSQ